MLDYLPLIIVAVGIILVVKMQRDRFLASHKFHDAYRDGLNKGFEAAKEVWRQDLEESSKKGLVELLSQYPVLAKVVENRQVLTGDSGTPVDEQCRFILPRVAYTIIVESKYKQFAQYGELKATWEKML